MVPYQINSAIPSGRKWTSADAKKASLAAFKSVTAFKSEDAPLPCKPSKHNSAACEP